MRINEELTRNNGIVKALVFYYPPLVFKDENRELVGSIIIFLYGFCHFNGYQLDLKMATSIEELNQAIQNKSFDIVNYLIQDNKLPEYSYFIFGEEPINHNIRFSNHFNSIIWNIYESPIQYDGEPLGCLKEYSFEFLYKENLPNSKVKYYDNNYDFLYFLLREDIEGFLTDETIAKLM